MNIRIPFNRPSLSGKEFDYIKNAIEIGHASGNGIFTKKSQELLSTSLNVNEVFLTTSCTHALEMAALLFEINPGDEFLIPSFTFVSTVNAFCLRGAIPKFVDIRPDTLNIDEELIEKKITAKTKVIIPVHYAGVGCEMNSILKIAEEHKIPVIEDNAHGLFGKYDNRYLGSFGKMATLSFHETKNISCGEGGALIINDPQYIERAEIIREKGTNRSHFFRGEVDRYTWVDLGSSYIPSDLLAAYLYAQLESRFEIQLKRKEIWNYYNNNLFEWAQSNEVKLPFVPTNCEQSFHLFYLIFPSLEFRQQLIEHLRSNGIYAVFHYQPLHLSQMGRKYGGKKGDCPVTEYVSDRILRLPFYNSITDDDLALVVNTIKKFNFLNS